MSSFAHSSWRPHLLPVLRLRSVWLRPALLYAAVLAGRALWRRVRWRGDAAPARPSPELVAAVLHSPDILSQVLSNLGLAELVGAAAAVRTEWRGAAAAACEDRRVLRIEGTIGDGKGATPGCLDLPFFACVLQDGGLLVSDFFNHRLQLLDGGCSPRCLGKAQGVELACPMGVACDGVHLYVAENGTSCIQKLRLADGVQVRGAGSHGSSDGQLKYPHGVALAPAPAAGEQAAVYVADNDNHRVVCYDDGLEFCFAFGRKGGGAGELCDPCGLATLCGVPAHEDAIVVCDLGNHRLQVFGLRGAWMRTLGRHGSAPGEFNGPWGVAVAELARGAALVVGESRGRRVQVLTLDGAPLQVLAPPGSGSLAGVCVEHRLAGASARARRVYVADYGRNVLHCLAVCDGGAPRRRAAAPAATPEACDDPEEGRSGGAPACAPARWGGIGGVHAGRREGPGETP